MPVSVWSFPSCPLTLGRVFESAVQSEPAAAFSRVWRDVLQGCSLRGRLKRRVKENFFLHSQISVASRRKPGILLFISLSPAHTHTHSHDFTLGIESEDKASSQHSLRSRFLSVFKHPLKGGNSLHVCYWSFNLNLSMDSVKTKSWFFVFITTLVRYDVFTYTKPTPLGNTLFWKIWAGFSHRQSWSWLVLRLWRHTPGRPRGRRNPAHGWKINSLTTSQQESVFLTQISSISGELRVKTGRVALESVRKGNFNLKERCVTLTPGV